MTASARERSMRPFKKARFVNSPGAAGSAPFVNSASSTRRGATVPPCVLISTVSSPVKVRGASITVAKTSSIFSPSAPTMCP